VGGRDNVGTPQNFETILTIRLGRVKGKGTEYHFQNFCIKKGQNISLSSLSFQSFEKLLRDVVYWKWFGGNGSYRTITTQSTKRVRVCVEYPSIHLPTYLHIYPSIQHSIIPQYRNFHEKITRVWPFLRNLKAHHTDYIFSRTLEWNVIFLTSIVMPYVKDDPMLEVTYMTIKIVVLWGLFLCSKEWQLNTLLLNRKHGPS
jgi:hypothetical protein